MVTVADVLADDGLALRPLHVARPELDVRWVATSELPDPAPFLQGGEILLTTGLQAHEWSGEWSRYVDGLIEAGAVAIGFGTGLSHVEVPQGLSAACRASGLTLFEVRRQTPFVAVSHRVSRLLAEHEETVAREALAMQRRLTGAAAKPEPERAVIHALAEILGGAAAIAAGNGDWRLEPVGRRRADISSTVVATEVRRLRQRHHRSTATVAGPGGTLTVLPVAVHGPRPDFLVALGNPRLSEAHRSAVTTTVALLGLIAEQHRHGRDTRRELRSRAVDFLTRGDARTAELVLGVDPTLPRLPRVMRIVVADGPSAVLDDALVLCEERFVAAESDARLCVVCPNADALAIARQLAGLGMRIGVGSVGPGAEAADSYRTAGLALAQATSASVVVEWENLVQQGPLGFMNRDDARRFAASFLGDLDTDQLVLLRCFLRHHGSRVRVAEELGVHRNTVRNRLDDVAAQLPGTLDDPQIRASAWIALQCLVPGLLDSG